MGGTVGIEAAKLEALDYETVKASGMGFGTAHNVLQRSLKKAKSINISDDQTTIHFLAIRQLSNNLKNQKVLERTKHKVLKTKSVPHNVKYRQHSFEYEGLREVPGEEDVAEGETEEAELELEHEDLDLVHDDEYYHHHKYHTPHHRNRQAAEGDALFIDDGPPWDFKEHARHDQHGKHPQPGHHVVGAAEDIAPHVSEGGKDLMLQVEAEAKDSRGETDGHSKGVGHSAEPLEEPAVPAPTPAPAPSKPRKPRPNLSLQLTSDVSSNALPIDATVNVQLAGSLNAAHKYPAVTQSKSQHPLSQQQHDPAHPKGMPPSPSANVRVSPRGTLYMGKWKVMETGIFPDESLIASARRSNTNRNLLLPSASVGVGVQGHHVPARAHNSSSGNLTVSLQRTGTSSSTFAASSSRLGARAQQQAAPPALGGKRDFLEINTLGSGASGVVSEAIHLPSLTIVALKMLPVYNQEKRQHVARELGVLYKNLAELRLVDDSLYQEEDEQLQQKSKQQQVGAGEGGGLGGVSSPHILSLYNAFVDPRSGMINLVIEYMDGGSLEDLVQQGGCRDEKVLADIAYQTVKGLCFLHANKSIHRDIKPANILCSTSGLIKIGDFGISKALDKTSGFANSFVGTVSYMSPERITGESYSYSCDVWSLGLTLLAVAKGRFPLNTRESKKKSSEDGNGSGSDDQLTTSTGSPQQVVGGAAGYWAMIKAICDDDPPKAGPFFSADFNAFIDACLKKDPSERLSSKQLLSLPFIEKNAATLKMSFSDLQARRRKLSEGAALAAAGVGSGSGGNAGDNHHALAGAGSAGAARRGSRGEEQQPLQLGGAGLTVSTAAGVVDDGPDPVVVPPSPLTTRLTNAAITRRTSKDFPAESPTAYHRKSAAAGSGDGDGGLASALGSGKVSIPENEEVGEESEDGVSSPLIDGQQSASDVIIAIRLEHLDRVLDRIAHRLKQSKRQGRRYSSASGDDNEDGVWEDEDGADGYDDTAESDLADVHRFGDEFSGVQDDPLLQPHDSVDSMDKLLQFKQTEPSPPALQLPPGKFRKGGPAQDDCDPPAEAKMGSPERPLQHKGDGKEHDEHSDSDNYKREDKMGAVHGILKHTHGPHDSATQEDLGNVLMRAEDKKAIFASARARSTGTGSAFNSSRSVHFAGPEEGSAHPPGTQHGLHAAGHVHHAAAHSIAMVAEGSGAEGEEDTGEAAATALSHPSLPKTSSYFVQSRFQQLGHRRDAKEGAQHGGEEEGDADSDENDSMAVVDHAIAVSEATAQAVQGEPPAPPVDYARMLPKLNKRGLPKWENLARQLHLPLHLVKLAVRSRLGGLVDLDAEEEGVEEEEEGEQGVGDGEGRSPQLGEEENDRHRTLPVGQREAKEQ